MSNFRDTAYSILNEDAAQRAADDVTRQVKAERERQAEFPTPEQRAVQSQPTTQTPEEEAKSRQRNTETLRDMTIAREAEKAREATPEGRREIDDEQRAKMGLDPRTAADFEAIDTRRQDAEKRNQQRSDFRKSIEGKAAIAAQKEVKNDAKKNRMAIENSNNYNNNSGLFGSSSSNNQGKNTRYSDAAVAARASAAKTQKSVNKEADEEFKRNRDTWDRDKYGGIQASEDRDLEREERANSDAAVAAKDAAIKRRQAKEAAAAVAATAAAAAAAAATAAKSPQKESYSHNKALTFFAEQLKRKYIEEEVVNPEHQPMSKSEISHRNKIRGKSPAKDARVVKGPRGRLDTSEEAKYRLATYITMRGRKGKKKENK